MRKITSFFDQHYRTPEWLLNKQNNNKQASRRSLLKGSLKAAGGASVVAAMPINTWALAASSTKNSLNEKVKTDPWLTLDAVVNHLLPESDSGPSAKDVNALTYLYNVVHLQPTEQSEINFIYKGVGWLNGYSQSEHKQNFNDLPFATKETLLRGISRSTAGENWLNTLLGYVMEALLTPPVYGGNTNQKGWQWLEHSGGYPLPSEGTRFYEIPQQQAIKISLIPTPTSTAPQNTAANVLQQRTNKNQHITIVKGKKA